MYKASDMELDHPLGFDVVEERGIELAKFNYTYSVAYFLKDCFRFDRILS